MFVYKNISCQLPIPQFPDSLWWQWISPIFMCQRLIVSRVRGLEGSRVRFLQGGSPPHPIHRHSIWLFPGIKTENATQNKSFDVSYSERARNFRPGVSSGARGIVYAETQGSLDKGWLANDLISRSAKQIFTKEIAGNKTTFCTENASCMYDSTLLHDKSQLGAAFLWWKGWLKTWRKKCGRHLGFASTTMV